MDADQIQYDEQERGFAVGISESEFSSGEQGSSSRKRKTTSEVWNHLTRIDNDKATCNYCARLLSAGSAKGTSHLKRHLDLCKEKPKFGKVANMLIDHERKLRAKKIDQKIWREMIAKMIIGHELPFSFVEYDLFRDMMHYANSDIKMICRNTVAADVHRFYEFEKEKLKLELAKVRSRICLTSNLWTAITHEGYICVTGHYVDEDWKLRSKILSFCSMPLPHSGMEIAKKIYVCLKDWGIEKKIFSLTIDNASSSGCIQDILKHQLCLQSSLLCKGEFFHVRCSAHILNIIVQNSLKVISDVVDKIRESVKYVRASESRMKLFEECADQVGRETGASLSLDVVTRWNSTHTMLDNALKYRYAFSSLELIDKNYKCCPSNEEWAKGEKIRDFLKPFDEITTLVSGSATSNLYFMKVWKIKMLLKDYGQSEDELIKSMAEKMQVKFDKYWEQYSFILGMGVLLDPRMKLKVLKYCYDQIDKNSSQVNVDKVKSKLYLLYKEYKSRFEAPISKCSSSHETDLMEQRQSATFFYDLYGCDDEECSDDGLMSGLDKYLSDAKLNLQLNKDLDVLDFWKTNIEEYGIALALMASDILNIPITTVASESSFSAGSRVLNKYRNRLLPSNVQALLCVRSWLFGFTEYGSGVVGLDGSLASSLPSMVGPQSIVEMESIGSHTN